MSIREEIKSLLAIENKTMKDIAEQMETTIQNLSQKLRNKTIKFEEVCEITDLLGYDIEFVKRK